jgi:hypothetical protein
LTSTDGARSSSASQHWGHELGVDLTDATFAVHAKVLPTTTKWERERYATLAAEPWTRVGTVRWIDVEFSVTFPEFHALGGTDL